MANPWLLLVAIPLLAVVIIGFFFLPKQKRFRTKNIISFSLHIVLCFVISLAFADIQFLNVSSETEVLAVVDCSASTEKSAEKIDSVLDTLYDEATKDKGTKVGVVAFGKNQEMFIQPGDKSVWKNHSIQEVFDEQKIDGSATDLKNALLYANEQFQDDVVRKMVIISDGNQTDNDAIDVLDTLLSNSVYIDAVSIDDTEFDEFAITGLEYTAHAYVGLPQSVKVSVKSTKQANVNVDLICLNKNDVPENKTIQSKAITISRGLNVIAFDLPYQEEASYSYQVQIEGDDALFDVFKENNVAFFEQDFRNDTHVLFIGSKENGNKDLYLLKSNNVFGTEATFDAYIDPSDVPYKIPDLIQYDEIVISDFDISNLNKSDEFIANLRTVVNDYGKSLVTYGATNISDADLAENYYDMLPVQYDSDDAKAVVLVIDCSYSMETDNRLEKAKQGCNAVLDSLKDTDFISIIGFSDDTEVKQSLTSCANRAKVKKAISSLELIGGTTMNPALRAAYSQLQNSKVENKYVITLTDGDPFDSETDLKRSVVAMSDDNIICSFINISNNSTSAISLLKSLSRYGGGDYIYCSNANQLVSAMTDAVVENEDQIEIPQEGSAIAIRTPEDPALISQVDETNPDQPKFSYMNDFNSLDGFNYCRIKNAATTVLTTQYVKEKEDDESSESDDGIMSSAVATIPIYAYWNFGKGKVSSFTASLTKNNWTSNFFLNSNGVTLLKNQAKETLPNNSSHDLVNMTYSNNGVTSDVYVTASDESKTGTIHAIVTSPSGTIDEYEFIYDGKQYVSDFKTGEVGAYNVKVSYTYSDYDDNGKVIEITVTSENNIYFDYSKEYDFFSVDETNKDVLDKLSEKNGNLYHDEYRYGIKDSEIQFRNYISSMLWFILASVILFLIDIFVRKSDFKNLKKKMQPQMEIGRIN